MATLEKIRSKSVFLLVIIGLALLAFILTDFLTSGRTLFSNTTTIAKVDGHKIDIQDFQKRVEQESQRQQAQGRKVDMASIQSQVLNQMVAEALYKQELADLGLTVTDKELSAYMLGDGAPMLDAQVAQATGGAVQSVSQLYDMIGNPAKYSLQPEMVQNLQNFAQALESDIEAQLLEQKFNTLFTGTLVANQLDAKALYNDASRTSHIAYAKADYSSIPDEDVEVTDDDLKKEYDRTRNNYLLNEEARTVSYITVDIVPSAADFQNGQANVEQGVAALAGTQGSQGLEGNNEFVVSTFTTPAGKINDNRLKTFLDSASVGATSIVSQMGNDYTIAKLLQRSQRVDSVNVDFLAVAGAELRDSLLNGLNAGTITLAQALENADLQAKQDSMWVSLFDPNVAPLKETLTTAQTGVWFTPDSAMTEGGRLLRVRTRRAEVPVYEYVTALYTVEPSNATVNTLMTDLTKYLADNTTVQAFTDNALNAGYQVQTAVVTPSSAHLGNVPDSRNAVRWVMKDAKKGQISKVFGNEETGRFIVVAVNDIYDGEYVPFTEPRVRDILTATVRNDKKAAKLIEQYKGKANDIAGYAALMSTSVDTTTVNFAQPMIPKIGMNESRLAASVNNAKVGQIEGPVQASNGVITYVVLSVDENGRPYSFDESAAQFEASRGGNALLRNRSGILLGRSKVKNYLLDFYRE